MKTLKNKLVMGAFALASLGFFGEKNLSAQDADSLSKDSIKITVSCTGEEIIKKEKIRIITLYCPKDKDTDNPLCWVTRITNKTVPCSKDKNLNPYCLARLNHKGNKDNKFISSIDYTYDKKENKLIIETLNFSGQMGTNEAFYVHYDSNYIDYGRRIDTNKNRDFESGIYTLENLTRQDIEDKFGEGFVRRTAEIINSQGDSLRMVNLIKKEYEMGKLVNENGEVEKVAGKFY